VIESILSLPDTVTCRTEVANLRTKALLSLHKLTHTPGHEGLLNCSSNSSDKIGYRSMLELLPAADTRPRSENHIFYFIYRWITRSLHPVAGAARDSGGGRNDDLRALLKCVRFPCLAHDFVATYVLRSAYVARAGMKNVAEWSIVYAGASISDRASMKSVAVKTRLLSSEAFINRGIITDSSLLWSWMDQFDGVTNPPDCVCDLTGVDAFQYELCLTPDKDSKDNKVCVLLKLRTDDAIPPMVSDFHKTVTMTLGLYPHADDTKASGADFQATVTGTLNQLTPELVLFRGSYDTFAVKYVKHDIVKFKLNQHYGVKSSGRGN
jgi:hypothetical protein